MVVGLGAIFFMMRYFTSKNNQHDADLKAMMMKRIDEVFPQLEQILSMGLEVHQVVVGDDPIAIAEVTRVQSDEDKATQAHIEASNVVPSIAPNTTETHIEPRAVETAKDEKTNIDNDSTHTNQVATDMPLDGGFVS
ncbi:hypothetical protein FACS1894199_03050 [Bacteroidia bacterium]|nr:hypothetical protein FACS1894199_03050 [Bacteroidia bacterium]